MPCLRLQLLVGDPRQLQAMSEIITTHTPIARGGTRELLLHHSRSTMERLSVSRGRGFARSGGCHSAALSMQYRMNATICSLCSSMFYRACVPLLS